MTTALTTRLLKNPPKTFRLDPALREYSILKARIHEVLILGRERIEREFMLMRYYTGLLINEHARLNGDRAAYGARAVLNLEKDFDIDHTELHRYAKFARSYPIVGGRPQLRLNLTWAHYRKLMVVTNDKRRYELTAKAEENEWSFEEVEAKVRFAVGTDKNEKKPERLPFVCLGPFFTYKIIRIESIHSGGYGLQPGYPEQYPPVVQATGGWRRRREASSLDALSGELLLDLGFKHRLEMGLFPRARFSEGMIVTAAEKTFSLVKAESGHDDSSLYTYKARVEEVLDGDTLKVNFLLGFGNRKGETIRLNHIDCPEIGTPEGKAAKRFVQSELAGSEFITVKSTRTRKEKWGRYLGDVFYARKSKGPLIYLNQLLLDKGHAVRVHM